MDEIITGMIDGKQEPRMEEIMEEIEEWLTNNLERQGEALLLGRVLLGQ
jgi:hypothetical protein